MPLAAGEFVGNFDAVAVRVVKVDADGNAVVGDVVDGDVLCLEAVVELLEVVEAAHHPRHVVQSHLAGLNAGGVRAHFDEGDFVGLLRVRGHKSGAAGHKVVGVEAQHIGVPLPGAFRVADKKVDMAQVLGFVGHSGASGMVDGVSFG